MTATERAKLALEAADELEADAEDLFYVANLLERAKRPDLARNVAAKAEEIKGIARKLRGGG